MSSLVVNTANAIEINLKEEIKMEEKITELIKNDIELGEGREAEKGLSVTVHYTGWLHDASAKEGKGKKFDSSLDRREPFKFVLGVGQVIKGWDEGVNGMKIGGHRLIMIPSVMGYGSRGAGGAIPPDADLIFDVQLLGID
tara:strand:+ start:1060 stop:1482 length:423 start_codon:yes stop_codon:yes gene_type:complete